MQTGMVIVVGGIVSVGAIVLIWVLFFASKPRLKPRLHVPRPASEVPDPPPLPIAGRKRRHPSKTACIMYSIWHDNAHQGGSFMQTGSVPTDKWGWWGVPVVARGSIANYTFMRNRDPELPNHKVIDAHVDLLNQLDVDFIYLDLSNGEQQLIVDGAKALCRRYSQLVRRGIATPKVTFFIQGMASIAFFKSTFYGGAYDPGIFATLNGKKLLLVGSNHQAVDRAAWSDGAFEYRRIWGGAVLPKQWSFKELPGHNTRAFSVNGRPEQSAAIAAVQSTLMAQNGRVVPSAVGRKNGDTLRTTFAAAVASGAPIISVGIFNEWCAQNSGTPSAPSYTDIYLDEHSACIEPVQGSHGSRYFTLTKQLIADWKRI